MKTESVGTAPFPPSLRDAAAARPVMSCRPGSVLAVAFHEAAHCIAGRYLGFEIGIATIVPSRHFGGAVRGPGCDLDEIPADMIADARARCEEALAHMPGRGEPRGECGAWSVHATSRCIELMAGKEGERLSGFYYEGGGCATDMALALAYAATVVYTDAAIGAYLKFCSTEARAILRKHRTALDTVANGLLEHKTLNGQQIDDLIFQAEAADELEAERKRRATTAKAAEHARFVNRLREVLHYEPETGVFTWLVSTGRRTHIGDVAGCIKGGGYQQIRIDGSIYLSHRLAFFFITGIWPRHQIDHINMARADNRWINLRMATRSQNMANRRAYAANKSGFKGVSFNKKARKWKATICIDGKNRHLGSRDTREEAATLYAEAAEKYHGEFARVK
jgi:hypothetical protein